VPAETSQDDRPPSDSPESVVHPASSSPRPALSVVLVAASGSRSIERTMGHLSRQTARRAMEVIVVAPSAATEVQALGDSHFAALRVVIAGPITSRGNAAALGILNATAPLVGLIEDHSFPEPEWAEALIRAHEGVWTGVGPAVANANPTSVMSWVNFILAYGQFAGPVLAGERDLLPWHNSVYKREAIAPFSDRLGALLGWEGALQDALRARGHTLYLEPAARTQHMNVSGFASTIGLNLQRGRILAALRAEREGWGRTRRLLQASAFPLFPLLQLRHLWPTIGRVGVPSAMLPRVFLALLMVLAVLAVGEAIGLAAGMDDAIDKMEDFELHRLKHVSRRERIEANVTATSNAEPPIDRTPKSA
jgi:hypothetical protein